MRHICVAVLLALSAGIAQAKCADRLMHIYGKVEEAPGIPAKGVPVGIAWLTRGQVSGPALGVTGDDGAFSIRFRFNRSTGSGLMGDRCHGKLSQVSVATLVPGPPSTPVDIAVGDADEIDVGLIGRDALRSGSCGVPQCGS